MKEVNITDFSDSFKEKWGIYPIDNLCMKYAYRCDFPNGYSASIVKGMGQFVVSFGYRTDTWEVALLKSDRLVYENDFKCDVLGYLTEEKVGELLEKISNYS